MCRRAVGKWSLMRSENSCRTPDSQRMLQSQAESISDQLRANPIALGCTKRGLGFF